MDPSTGAVSTGSSASRDTRTTTDELAEAFSAELTHWREVRGMSKKRLAAQMGFDPSYISHVESGRHRPTEDFARRAESVLNSSHALWRRWQAYETARRLSLSGVFDGAGQNYGGQNHHVDHSAGIVVERESAELRYRDGVYHVVTRRLLRNVGTEPITRFLMRISVDRFPDDPERSNQLYREQPLTWDELKLTAECGYGPLAEPMTWKAKHDRDAFKEVWLLFENETSHFPLYPGESTPIEYAYQVDDHKWGSWFQRAIRLPTTELHVRLVFPAELRPAVWGTETSMTASAAPFRTAIHRAEEHLDGEDMVAFDWSTDHPPLHARYRLEWRFRGNTRPNPPAVLTEAVAASHRLPDAALKGATTDDRSAG